MSIMLKERFNGMKYSFMRFAVRKRTRLAWLCGEHASGESHTLRNRSALMDSHAWLTVFARRPVLNCGGPAVACACGCACRELASVARRLWSADVAWIGILREDDALALTALYLRTRPEGR